MAADTDTMPQHLTDSEQAVSPDPDGSGRPPATASPLGALRILVPRPVRARSDSLHPHLAIILDTETTGLRHQDNEVIEIGMIAVTFDDEGELGDVVGTFEALQEPGQPLDPRITDITGITSDMLAGQHIDHEAMTAFVAEADLIIAHHAAFDRPFCEKLSPCFVDKDWACSVAEINWGRRGTPSRGLEVLAQRAGFTWRVHRALDDCHALLEVLTTPFGITPSPFAELIAASRLSKMRVVAVGAHYDDRHVLKARGYRWSNGTAEHPKAWWTQVSEDQVEGEVAFLHGACQKSTRTLAPRLLPSTARTRFRG